VKLKEEVRRSLESSNDRIEERVWDSIAFDVGIKEKRLISTV